MELSIIDSKNTSNGKIKMPIQFGELVRPDLIKRAVVAVQNNRRQRYGAKPGAGMRASAKISRRRRDYKGSYGHGISRVPRKILTHRGTQFNWAGAVAPGTVSGRKAHPPKATKDFSKKINKKENRKAIRSAMAATLVKSLVQKRNHKIPTNYPFILDDDVQGLAKTKDVQTFLVSVGLKEELARVSERTIRAGRGKMRGRKYTQKVGPLLVVGEDCPLLKSSLNIPGVNAVKIKNINAELLAPGTDIARLTLYTKSAIERINKESLFLEKIKTKKSKEDKAGKEKK